MLEESRSQSIPRYGGMKIVGDLSTLTENLEALNIGNHSRVLSRPPKELFFDSKIQEVTNKSYGPWKLMN